MNTRIALVSFVSIVSLALGGCSADAPEPVNGPSGGGSSRAPAQGTQAPPESGEQATQPETTSGEEGAPADGTPADPSGKQPTVADPTCVASCNSGLKTKCQGDDLFCEDVCITMTAQELSCLSSAPTCEKPEWIRCMPEQNSGGSK
jgi:hypothetical protein